MVYLPDTKKNVHIYVQTELYNTMKERKKELEKYLYKPSMNIICITAICELFENNTDEEISDLIYKYQTRELKIKD